jgi:hypothetical protein
MEIRVVRDEFTSQSTTSRVFVNGEQMFYGLEPAKRDPPYKPRAIPVGTYEVRNIYSDKHKRIVPHVVNVPGFQEIEIHIGNYPHDTEGCLLIGRTRSKDFVAGSAEAFDELYTLTLKAEGAITITYTEET